MAKDENRLYFIARSILLNSVAGALFLTVIWYLRSINFIQSLIIGTSIFVFSLAISRLFDSFIGKLVERILKFLGRHQRLKKFVLNYF